MGISKTMFTSILISLVLIMQVAESDTMVMNTMFENPSPSPIPIDCDGECDRRCELASRQKICKRACGTCCERCNCVPSGTSGHFEECPCYANMTTHGGKHKCP